jgi:hypothetical protein
MDEITIRGDRLMATEAQNILDRFYSANKAAELKEEQREFKRGSFGFMGGLPGFLIDTAAGLETVKGFDALTEAGKELFDTRDSIQKTLDLLSEREQLETGVKNRLKELAKDDPKYKKLYQDYVESPLSGKTIDQIVPMILDDIGLDLSMLGVNFSNNVNKYTQGTRLLNITPGGQAISYTVGKFEPGKGMLQRFGQ